MSDRADVIYRYDGSFDGLMCCVFESYICHKLPCEIISCQREQISFFTVKEIITDIEKSQRIIRSIPLKISSAAFTLIQKGFLTNHSEKEMLIVKFLILGFRYGNNITDMLANDTVNALTKAVLHLEREAHLYLGFVRFSSYNRILTSVIEPKNIVLPIIAKHFAERFANENFIIFDKTNHMALIYKPYKAEIISAESIEAFGTDENEEYYSELWKTFYNTIGIEERFNPKCRMTMMPKRYWKHMNEVCDVINEKYKNK